MYGNTVLSVPTAPIESGPRRWLAIGSQLASPSSYAHKFLSRENFKGEYARVGTLLADSILSIDILQGMR